MGNLANISAIIRHLTPVPESEQDKSLQTSALL